MGNGWTIPSRAHRPHIARRSGLREELKVRVWAAMAFAALWLLGRSTRAHYVDAGELFDRWHRGERVILAFWHNRLVMMPFPYRGSKVCILNSAHRDGEIITRAVRRFGITAVRGSSTRGWMGGLRNMMAAYRQGYDLAVVPDGPRGPRYQAKKGAVQLAKVTAAPIFPVTYGAAKKMTISSWDGLLVPLPFTRIVYVVGPPITVAPDASSEEVEAKRRELEIRLMEITDRADAYFREPAAGNAVM